MLNENAIHWIKEGLRVGKYPGSKWLGEKLSVSTQEAQQILTEYKMRVMDGDLPGPGPVPPPPRDDGIKVFENTPPNAQPVNDAIVEAMSHYAPEPKRTAKKPTSESKKKPAIVADIQSEQPLHKEPLILTVIRQYALYAGMAIDLALAIAFFLAVSIDIVTSIGMFALAFIAVLFKVVAFVDGKKWLWALLMSLTWWASVSFAVVTISTQAHGVDSVKTQDAGDLARLEQQVSLATANLQKKNELMDAVPTGYKSELAVRKEAVTQAENQVKDAESRLEAAKAPAETAPGHRGISAENAFTAIPSVITGGTLGERIALAFFAILSFCLEYIIVWSAVPRKKD